MPTQGSWRPLVEMSVSSPATDTVRRVLRIELVGFTAKRTTTSWPVEMPPSTPPALLERKRTLPSSMRISSAFSSPESAAAAKPAPISTPFTALMPIIAVKRSEEHTSELQSLMRLSYAVFSLKKNNTIRRDHYDAQQLRAKAGESHQQ